MKVCQDALFATQTMASGPPGMTLEMHYGSVDVRALGATLAAKGRLDSLSQPGKQARSVGGRQVKQGVQQGVVNRHALKCVCALVR